MPDPSGETLTNHDEELFRQVHPSWVVDDEPSSQAFRPTSKDEGMLSVSRGSETSPEDAYRHHTEALELKSVGAWAVTVGEARDVELDAISDPVEGDPAHAVIDFRELGRGAREAKAKVLRAKAAARGCVFAPPAD